MKLSDKEFFSMADIAKLFGVSISHVKQYLRYELPEPVRVGKKALRWRRDKLETYIKNHTKN